LQLEQMRGAGLFMAQDGIPPTGLGKLLKNRLLDR